MIERHIVHRHLKMVCFDDGADRFQMRAAGIAIRDGRILVQNVKGSPVSFLPGGRVDQNEASTEAIVREIREEFDQAVEVGPLHFVVESFFPEAGQLFHEIGFFFGITVGPEFPYNETDICHRCLEGPVEQEYRWVPATAAALAAVNFYPGPLRSRLGHLPSATEHIVDREPL